MLRKVLFFVLVFGMCAQVFANQSVDSLRRLLPKAEGSEKLDIYLQIYLVMDGSAVSPDEYLRFLYDFRQEAAKQGHTDHELTTRTSELVHYFNNKQTARFMEVYPTHERFIKQHGKVEDYLSSWLMKIRMYVYDGRNDEAMNEAEQMRREMADRNDPYISGVINAQIGIIYYGQDHTDEAIPLLMESINMMEEKTPYDPVMIYEAYHVLSKALYKEKRIDEMIQACSRYEALLREEARQTGWDINTSDNLQILYPKFYCYDQYARAYLAKGELKKAREYMDYCRQILANVDNDAKAEFYTTQSIMYDKQGDYARAAEQTQLIIDLIESGNIAAIGAERADWYRTKAAYLAKAKRTEEAIANYDTAYTQLKTGNHAEFEKRLVDLRTRYQVDRLVMEKERNRNYFVFAILGCVMLVAILLLIVSNQRRLRARNRKLVQRIQNQDALEEELRELRHRQLAALDKEDIETSKAEADSPAILFARLEDYMRDTNCYLDPELDRQSLINALATNQTYLYSAVKKATGLSLQEYINSLRLQWAKETLRSKPEVSVSQVAGQCGFAALRTFNRHFKNQYGITPTEYRRAL